MESFQLSEWAARCAFSLKTSDHGFNDALSDLLTSELEYARVCCVVFLYAINSFKLPFATYEES